MRLALIIGRKQDEKLPSVIAQPADSRQIGDQFKKLLVSPHNYVHIELWDSNSGRIKRKFWPVAPSVKAAAGGENQAPQGPAPAVVVPTLEELIAKDISEDSAKSIIQREQAKADAQKANPALTVEELDKIGAAAIAPAPKKPGRNQK